MRLWPAAVATNSLVPGRGVAQVLRFAQDDKFREGRNDE